MSFHVYAIAEKYDIPGFQILAATRFKTLAETEWRTEKYLTARLAVYDTTPHNNGGLRNIVVDVSIEHGESLFGRADEDNLAQVEADFANDGLVAYDHLLGDNFTECYKYICPKPKDKKCHGFSFRATTDNLFAICRCCSQTIKAKRMV